MAASVNCMVAMHLWHSSSQTCDLVSAECVLNLKQLTAAYHSSFFIPY